MLAKSVARRLIWLAQLSPRPRGSQASNIGFWLQYSASPRMVFSLYISQLISLFVSTGNSAALLFSTQWLVMRIVGNTLLSSYVLLQSLQLRWFEAMSLNSCRLYRRVQSNCVRLHPCTGSQPKHTNLSITAILFLVNVGTEIRLCFLTSWCTVLNNS